jgi:hypothetical protein
MLMNSCQVEFCFSFEKVVLWSIRVVHGSLSKYLRKPFFLTDRSDNERGGHEIDSHWNQG